MRGMSAKSPENKAAPGPPKPHNSMIYTFAAAGAVYGKVCYVGDVAAVITPPEQWAYAIVIPVSSAEGAPVVSTTGDTSPSRIATSSSRPTDKILRTLGRSSGDSRRILAPLRSAYRFPPVQKLKINLVEGLVESVREKNLLSEAYLLAQRFQVKISVMVHHGAVGIGLLTKAGTEFYQHVVISGCSTWREVELATPAIGDTGSLVIRNASRSGPSRAQCRIVETVPLKIGADYEDSEPLFHKLPKNMQLYRYIMGAAAASADFRQKVFEPGYPTESEDKISTKIGYMNSNRNLGEAIRDGFYGAMLISNYIDTHCDLEENANILDFGCGSLRVSRYLIQFADRFKYFACDVNSFSVKWAQSEFKDRANVFRMNNKPPLALGSESMDFIVCWSIFSHYSEHYSKLWIAELHRILRPSGYLLISFQSDHLIQQMTSNDMVAQTRSEGVDLKKFRRHYRKVGFGFYKCYSQTEDDFGFDVDNFGMAFISANYIKRNWTRLFAVMCIDPGAIGNFQDGVLLRKL